METRHDVIVRAAQLADELGYEAFAVPEGWGFDTTLLLGELALRTRRITLVSAILSVWGRTPATLAMTAATLYRLAKGRYVLGLGHQHQGAGGGVPRRRLRAAGRQAAGGDGQGAGAARR
jgi:alkanesulfonate monooxygenase SsuD/methylene tetrahydromethanopterin reductase-like flavin-dependent oxidoreductase (luciferase family)